MLHRSFGAALGLLLIAGCASPREAARRSGAVPASHPAPPDSLIPADAVGQAIRRGRAILLATHDSLPDHVGNALRCVSCHLDSGARVSSGSWVGVYASFPQYNKRGGRVFRIEDRINECLRRSLKRQQSQ